MMPARMVIAYSITIAVVVIFAYITFFSGTQDTLPAEPDAPEPPRSLVLNGIDVLEADNFRQLYIPPNFAHGFVVTSEVAQFEYKCTDYYDPSSELTIAWDDPDIGIPWPVEAPKLSERVPAMPSTRDVKPC